MELAHFASGKRDAARSERMTNHDERRRAVEVSLCHFGALEIRNASSRSFWCFGFGDFSVIFSSHRRPSRPNRQKKISVFEAKKRYEDNTSPCASHYTRARAAAELCYG